VYYVEKDELGDGLLASKTGWLVVVVVELPIRHLISFDCIKMLDLIAA
jgi:hypothetical protein